MDIGTWLDRIACSFDDIRSLEYWILNGFLPPSFNPGVAPYLVFRSMELAAVLETALI